MSDPPGAAQPRALAVVGGARIDLISFHTEENAFTTPDTFSITTAMDALPADHDVDWWSEASDIEVEIFAGRPADGDHYSSGDLTSVFVGKADEVVVDWAERTLTATGRDLSQPLIDTKASEKYVNKTASEVVEALAAKYGLTPVVTATTEKVGKLYQIDHVDLKDERTEWELVAWLARESGFRAFMKGRELHFEPPPKAGEGTPFLVKRVAADAAKTESGNYVALKTSRTLTVAGDIKVTVLSYQSKKKRRVQATAQRKGKSSGLLAGGGQKRKQEYSYPIPGLDQDQAQKRANQLLIELSKHEMKMGFSGPAEDGLTMTGTISLEGTATTADQIYFPDSISRELDPEDGYSWTVEAKNHATESEPTL